MTSTAVRRRPVCSEFALGRLKMVVKCSAERIGSFGRPAGGGGGGWRRLKFHVHLCGVAVCIGHGAA